MTALMIILGFTALLVVGFLSLFKDFFTLVEERDLLAEFRGRFVSLANAYFDKGSLDEKGLQDYHWLLENVDEVSSVLGGADTMTYRPAFANYIINNYRLLINLIPSFGAPTGVHANDVSSADSILVRFIGIINKQIAKDRKKLINPIHWLIEGVAAILSAPLWLLSQFGILGKNVYVTVRQSNSLRFIAGLFSLVSVIDTVAAMITGNSFTIELLKQLPSLL